MAATAPQENIRGNDVARGKDFRSGLWQTEINVRDFIQQNYEPYDGDESFLAPATERTHADLGDAERNCSSRSGKKACSTSRRFQARSPPTLPATSIERTRSSSACRPTRRSSARSCPNGGFRMVVSALKAYGYEPDPHVVETFTKYRKTHNEGVFDAYTAGRQALPQLTHPHRTAGRVRTRADHRRLPTGPALRRHPADRTQKQQEKAQPRCGLSTDEIIRDREELSEQIRALKELQQMASSYGFDISGPARTRARRFSGSTLAISPASRNRTARRCRSGARSTFLDIYFERDLASGALTEAAGAGDHRRLRHQAAYRPVPAHARVRRALRRRSRPGSPNRSAEWETTGGRS